MKFNLLSIILLASAIVSGGCVEEEFPAPGRSEVEGESLFQLNVKSLTVTTRNESRASEPSSETEPDRDEERRIHDFWLFQFGQDGNQLAEPTYYTEQNATETLNVLTARAYPKLVRDTPMTIYVVTNTGDSEWAAGAKANNFNTLEKVKNQTLPKPLSIRVGKSDVFIPMSGQLDNVTVSGANLVVVPVTRMYAKLKIKANFGIEGMNVYDVEIKNIPWYSRVNPLADKLDLNGEPAAVPFPDNTYMVTSALRSTDAVTDLKGEDWLVLYVPENIRGEVAGGDKVAGTKIPENALTVNIRSRYNGMDYYYKVYPGENSKNNFNIRRNRVYRVTADIQSDTDQHNPSSNCFIVKPHDLLVFEPYYRVENGGGYTIGQYLSPNEEVKKIDRVDIIWQTLNCIGDNTKRDLVYLGDDTGDIHRKIIVKTNEEGNALIAARNTQGDIVWSWHIWVTSNEPDNLANAIVYTTYEWNSTGIDSSHRVPGYSVMPCNLGALAIDGGSSSEVGYTERFAPSEYRTFGMVYQWGRKDPFPPVICYTEGSGYNATNTHTYNKNGNTIETNHIYPTQTGYDPGYLPYENQYTEEHYANDNKTVVDKTSEVELKDANLSETYLFYSVAAQKVAEKGIKGIEYAIAHPTVYLSSANIVNNFFLGERINGYTYNNGDWLPENESTYNLWGGEETGTKVLTFEDVYAGSSQNVSLHDNYGTQKSVFDPCPTGWRVAPAELWLGFTQTGRNPNQWDVKEQDMPKNSDASVYVMPDVNWNREESGAYGMLMYMQGWHTGTPSYFPLQGMRIEDGSFFSNGWCGNYNNATCDGKYVNILHLHQNALRFHIFEYINRQYFVKSTASPVRCVRDSK